MVEVLSTNGVDSDNFQMVHKKKSAASKNKKRQLLYVGNLPSTMETEGELKEKLIQLFQDRAQCRINSSDISIVDTSSMTPSSSCHALVSCCDSNIRLDGMVQCLHRVTLDGRRLVVQREHKRKPLEINSPKKQQHPSLGGSSWSTPRPRKNDTVQPNDMAEQSSEDPIGTASAMIGFEPREEEEEEFSARCSKQPISSLLDEYGEQDLDWKQLLLPQPKQIDSTTHEDEKMQLDSTATTTAAPVGGENRLGQKGRAPIHVEFASFGYLYGAPVRKGGWSHAQPLSPVDCRLFLEPVQHYLAWQNGLSGAVKRALLPDLTAGDSEGKSVPSIRQAADDLAKQVADVLIEAMEQWGYGYAQPLSMTVSVGSELGRHRSVVFCELAGTALRNRLRSNDNSQFTQPCSVGTRHRDIERHNNASAKGSSIPASKSKQCDLEDDA
jgi:hypothetical protein